MITWSHYTSWLQGHIESSVPTESPAPGPEDWSTDSRCIGKNQWFLPIKGENFDGHRFITSAMEQGAAGFFADISEKPSLPQHLHSQGVFVKNTLKAYQLTGLGWRKEQKNLRLCALTGSVGKTTCKQMLGTILQEGGATLSPADNFNNEVGVPHVLLRLKPEHKFCVLELGARKPGDIKDLVDCSHPDVTACLNAGNTHLEIFRTREALRKTKLEILRHRPPNAASCVLHDDPVLLEEARAIDPDVTTFGRHKNATVRIVRETWNDQGSLKLSLSVAGEPIDVTFTSGHEAWPVNAAAACAMALRAGIPASAMSEGLSRFQNIGGRFHIISQKFCTLIDDTYNASPASMLSGLKTLARLYPREPKVVILGDMLELGSISEEEHFKTGRYCAELLTPLTLISVGPQARFIAEGALEAGLSPDQTFSYKDPEEVISKHPSLLTENGVVYAKASRAMQLDKIINYYR